MWEAEVGHFAGLLSQVFPTHASIHRCLPFDTVSFKIDWPLETDTDRPNKRSRLIIVCLSREFMSDYVAASPNNQTSETKRVVGQIKAKLAQFDPTHDSPKNALPPEETWAF